MRLFLGARMPRLAQLRFAAPLATAQARSARPLGAPSVGTPLNASGALSKWECDIRTLGRQGRGANKSGRSD